MWLSLTPDSLLWISHPLPTAPRHPSHMPLRALSMSPTVGFVLPQGAEEQQPRPPRPYPSLSLPLLLLGTAAPDGDLALRSC